MARSLTIAVVAAALALSPTAFGQDDRYAARSARADVAFHEAESLLAAGHVSDACAKFELSEQLETGLGTLLHLGDCYERAGRAASAWHTFLEAEALAHSKQDTEREQIAAERVQALEPKLPRVVFVVPPESRVPDLEVRLGDNSIPPASFGAIIPVDPGKQRVTASAKGRKPYSVELNIAGSEAHEYRVTIPALQPAPRPASDRRATFRTAGVVTGSAGLVGLGAGAIFGVISKNREDDANVDCPKGPSSCVSRAPGTNVSNPYSTASTVSLAVGGALVATGVTLFVLAPHPDNQEKDATRIAARVARDGGRLEFTGSW